MEYFRVPPRWLFVKITDEAGNVGWGEASLEGHTQAVEGCLDAWFERYNGFEADDIEHIWQMSWRTTFYRGGPVFMSALAGIDIALWDLKGKLQIMQASMILHGQSLTCGQLVNSGCQSTNCWEARCATSSRYMRG
jgi:L-alanine-DL-glutamate epimerase-like enolase superfamily enzyme